LLSLLGVRAFFYKGYTQPSQLPPPLVKRKEEKDVFGINAQDHGFHH
jgi:hypothetical protein